MIDSVLCRFRPTWVFNILIIAVLLSSCSSGGQYARVYDRRQAPDTDASVHRVSKGETLFSIAWRYGQDVNTLAGRNAIAKPYTIYPGQTLKLKGSIKKSAPTGKSSSAKTTQSSTAHSSKSSQNTSSRSKNQSQPVKKSPAPSYGSGPVYWRWPSTGKIIAKYSQGKSVNQGIDLAGKKGDSVITAAPGTVVYAGSGLRGYGNLLIVKHSETYLSAYAHNRRLMVKEKDRVKAGQKIAEMGSSGADRVKLHFEIRRNGKPVDPLKYLPKR